MVGRGHHRVADQGIEALDVIVVPAHGAPVRGRLLDLSTTGAGVEVSADSAVEPEEHKRVVLVIGAHQLEAPITVPATMSYDLLDTEGNRRCGFQFVDPEEFMRQLSPALDHLFEERHWLRIPPDPEAPVVATVKTLGEQGEIEHVTAEVNDISGIGVSIDVHVDAAERVEQMSPVRLVLNLPDIESDVEIAGKIRHRLPLGDRLRFGIWFLPHETQDWPLQQQRVVGYVKRCRERMRE